jgi:hypothetical protein
VEDSASSALRLTPHFFSTVPNLFSKADNIPLNSFCHLSTSFATDSALTAFFFSEAETPSLDMVIGIKLAFFHTLLKVERSGHANVVWVLFPFDITTFCQQNPQESLHQTDSATIPLPDPDFNHFVISSSSGRGVPSRLMMRRYHVSGNGAPSLPICSHINIGEGTYKALYALLGTCNRCKPVGGHR